MVTKEKDASNYTFLKYKNLEDMLKVILFSSQSPLGLVPLLYHIEAKKMQILFIQTGTVGGVMIHFIVEKENQARNLSNLID